MSVDTRDKRMSMLGLALAARLVLPNPDGAFSTAGDRAQLSGLYAGTLIVAAPAQTMAYSATVVNATALEGTIVTASMYTATVHNYPL